MTNHFETREGWLLSAADKLKREFFGTDRELPKVACSCGFIRGHARAIGVCHPPEHSADGTVNVFICPTQAEPVPVLATLLHELGHAHLGNGVAHKAPFARLMKEFGLAGKPTATYAEPESDCYRRLTLIAEDLGPYPHAAMKKSDRKNNKKVQWVKLVSVTDPEYKLSFAMNPSVEAHGYPQDPWGEPMVEA